MLKDVLNKIVGVVAGVLAVFSAIFYVLFKQKKEENEELKKSNEIKEKNLDALSEADKKVNMAEKENEKKLEKTNGNKLSNFNACLDFLRND